MFGSRPQPSVAGASCPAAVPPPRPTYIVYNQATGLLSYDASGNAGGGVIAFAVLTNRPVLAANDFQVI